MGHFIKGHIMLYSQHDLLIGSNDSNKNMGHFIKGHILLFSQHDLLIGSNDSNKNMGHFIKGHILLHSVQRSNFLLIAKWRPTTKCHYSK